MEEKENNATGDDENIIELGIDDLYLPGVTDLTCLKPDATKRDIVTLCMDAVFHQYRAVCVHSCWAQLCAAATRQSKTMVAVVTDFPLGAGGLMSKNYQAYAARSEGAREVDTVINIGAFRNGDRKTVQREINLILPTKVIIETGYWNDTQIRELTKIVMDTGAFCVKTSTGFGPDVASDEKARHVSIMREVIEKTGSSMMIKAAGGIKTADDAKKMISAGAHIIGSSARMHEDKEKEQ